MVHSPKSHVTTLTGIKQFVAVKNETASAIIPEGGISLMKFDIIPQRIHMAGNIISGVKLFTGWTLDIRMSNK